MTAPYDVENDLRKITQARVDADELTRAIAQLGDAIADGFRSRFDMSMDMEGAGTALVIAAAMLSPRAISGSTSPSILVDTLAMAGENLVRTARARAAEVVGRMVDVDGFLAAENEPIVEAFAEGDRVLWNPSNGNVESATVQSVNLLIRLDDNGDELVVEGRHCRAATQPGDFEAVEVECETVLSWHPVTADPSEPIEVPLNEDVAWCPEELGQFRVSTREIPPSTEDGAPCLS